MPSAHDSGSQHCSLAGPSTWLDENQVEEARPGHGTRSLAVVPTASPSSAPVASGASA